MQNNSVDLSGVLLKNDLALLETRRKRKGFLCVCVKPKLSEASQPVE